MDRVSVPSQLRATARGTVQLLINPFALLPLYAAYDTSHVTCLKYFRCIVQIDIKWSLKSVISGTYSVVGLLEKKGN